VKSARKLSKSLQAANVLEKPTVGQMVKEFYASYRTLISLQVAVT